MKGQVEFQGHTVHELVTASSRVLVAPQFGARLLLWEKDGRRVIHWPDDADWSKVAGVRGGNPILFPFIARHMVDGVIGRWKDETGTVRELPMHGFARDMPFEVVESGGDSLRMRLVDTGATRAMYPFHFQLDVTYSLNGDVLESRLDTSNAGSDALPYYAGHHFYFAVPHDRRDQWRLTMPARRWGRQNPDGSVHFGPLEATTTSLADPASLDRMHLDLTASEITLAKTDGSSRLTMDLGHLDDTPSEPPWYAVTTWTLSPESDFFCIEPWLGLPNAIHHGHGLRWLPGGAHESAVCRIDATGW